MKVECRFGAIPSNAAAPKAAAASEANSPVDFSTTVALANRETLMLSGLPVELSAELAATNEIRLEGDFEMLHPVQPAAAPAATPTEGKKKLILFITPEVVH
jgi:hypothetical protein